MGPAVVDSTVVIDVANDDHLLRPGMPTDISIEIVRWPDTLKIANAALRFRPPLPPDQIRAALDQLEWPPAPDPIQVAPAADATTKPGQMEITPPPLKPAKAALWEHVGGVWEPVPVWTAFTDTRETAIFEDPGIAETTSFVVEVRVADESATSEFEQAILLSQPQNRRL